MTSEGQSACDRRRAITAPSTLHGSGTRRDHGLDFGWICAFLPPAHPLHIPDRPRIQAPDVWRMRDIDSRARLNTRRLGTSSRN